MLLVILLVFTVSLLLFQFKPVQTWAAKKAAAYLSGELKTTIDIKTLYIKPFSSVVLEGLYVLDKQKDTLLSAPELTVDLNSFSIFTSVKKRTIDFSLIELNNGSVYLKKQKDGTSNLRFIINYFSSPDTAKTKGKPWKVIFENIAINNFHFRYKNQLLPDTVVKQVNFDDVDVKNFSGVIKNMDLKNHLFKADISNLTLREKSGFYVKKFNALATVDDNQIMAQNLYILTSHSELKNYFRMKFKDFDDVSDHIDDKVYMEGDFHSSRISSLDVSYFTDGLAQVRFNLGLDGRVSGFVNNLNAKNLLVTGGKATYIKGNFRFKGLPHWHTTLLDLNFDEIATNKADMDYLYSQFTGTPGRHVPAIISKFGNINFTGRLKGFQDNFVAYGAFKTKLGRFDPNFNLKTGGAGPPSYSGKIETYAFDLGSLLYEKTLGRVTLNAAFTGSGDEISNLSGNLTTNISSIDFKGYHYQNLTLNGTFVKKIANALITIDDKNIGLNLSGNVDLNGAMPVYDLKAAVNNMQLNKLNLLNDTINISSQAAARFSGNSLRNLTGNLSLLQTRIVDPRNNYVLDSLLLAASSADSSRAITLKSDVADGYVKGKFDLATLPSYFKTIAKKYVPSLNTIIVASNPQDFEFELNLKNPDPLIAVLGPDLKIPKLSIPDLGTITGNFNSEKNTETLNAFIKTIKLEKTVFHDFILDESTYTDYLGLNISLSKVDLTDSLFIKNITVNNFLKKDSLNFNIKLSDQNAVNSLDLYGLVNFGKDTLAKLQLLPSDVILEHQDWRIAEKVRVKFLPGKTEVSGFELSNGLQKVKVNGFISDNPADELKLTFEKFSMATFNQLTRRPAGVQLKGVLNGGVKFTSLLKSPGIDAHLGIDSLTMNKTLVGDIKIASDLDNDRKQADIKININNHGMETLNLAGSYQIGHGADDNLDFDIKMNQTEGVIFEPFINDLVSHIKGNISTNLKLTGPITKPQLNGNIIFNNTGVTVNYLKTAYKVTDTLNVISSVVNISNMQVKDDKGGTGSITGTVDLNDLKNPDIEAVLNAKNLMALNTTFKDNHLYYGTAFATGRFGFNGPVDNMKIDIKASTEAGTVFNIPLNGSTTVGDNDFIHFVGHRDIAKAAPKSNSFDGVTLNFDLSADEKTTVRISTDYGLLEGNGKANDLKLNINGLGDFEMFGDFLISSGKFEFTAQNFISKNFLVDQGGTIRWTGNPSNATINLSAIYEVRTDIAPLYQAAGSKSPKGDAYELVQAELILTKTLLKPDIDFNFNFPLDPSIKDDLSNYLSDNNNRSQQALNIILRRNFSNGANGNLTNQVLNTAGEFISEFAFNKVNSLISQSNIKGFDLNLRSFNDFSASYKVKNRLIFTGSLFNSSSSSNDLFQNNTSIFNSNFSVLTKDFDAQYLIRKDGNLSARYSYRVLNSTTLNTLNDQLNADYVNGIGLVYQRDFDSLPEFIRLIFKKQNVNKDSPKLLVPAATGVSKGSGHQK